MTILSVPNTPVGFTVEEDGGQVWFYFRDAKELGLEIDAWETIYPEKPGEILYSASGLGDELTAEQMRTQVEALNRWWLACESRLQGVAL